jgi:hypothetical protein
VSTIADIERTSASLEPASWSSDPGSLGPSSPVRAEEIDVRWRPSRHARRLVTLAAAGLLLAVAFRRPELAGLAAPALLILGAGRATRGGLPGRLTVRVGLTATRIYEGEPAAVDVVVSGVDQTAGAAGTPGDTSVPGTAGAAGAGDANDVGFDVRWALEPGRGIEPGSATAVNGEGARFTFAIDRWGKRKLGSVTLTLHDRWRLAEGRVVFALPAVDCSGPRSSCPSCRTGWASTAPGCPATAPSSPGSASTCPGTGSGRSTGRPPPASAASR